jgi:hypothetical protein
MELNATDVDSVNLGEHDGEATALNPLRRLDVPR